MSTNRTLFDTNLVARRANGELLRDNRGNPYSRIPTTARLSALECNRTVCAARNKERQSHEDVEKIGDKMSNRQEIGEEKIGAIDEEIEDDGRVNDTEENDMEVEVVSVVKGGNSSLLNYSSSSDDEQNVEKWEKKMTVVKKAKKVSRRFFKNKYISKTDIGVLAKFVKMTDVQVLVNMDMKK